MKTEEAVENKTKGLNRVLYFLGFWWSASAAALGVMAVVIGAKLDCFLLEVSGALVVGLGLASAVNVGDGMIRNIITDTIEEITKQTSKTRTQAE